MAASWLIVPGNFVFRHRNYLFPIIFLSVFFLDRPRYPAGSATWDRWLDVVGVLLALSGQTIRAGVLGLASISRGGKDRRVHADVLYTDGLFAHSRNPLYVGNFLVFLGIFVVLNSPLGYLFGVPAVIFFYVSMVQAEENFLRKKFGPPYEEYLGAVPRFVPFLPGVMRTVAGSRIDWKRALRKEYGSTWSWLTAIIILFWWERVAVDGFEATRPLLSRHVAAWLAVTLAYGFVRFLKKTGRLRGD